jgi:polyisoprenoid-binding protein YceI
MTNGERALPRAPAKRLASIACLGLVLAFQACFDNEKVSDEDNPPQGGQAGDGQGGTSSGLGGSTGTGGAGGAAGDGMSGSAGAGNEGGGGADTGGSGGSAGVGGDPGGDPSITVEPTSGLMTSEEGDQATFTIRLGSRPASDVVIGISSDDTSEGTVEPAELTFTRDNWAAPLLVTVTGVNDEAADGPRTYNVVTAAATSDDGNYDGLDADDVEVENIDDETPGIRVTAEPDLETSEDGGEATFTVRLASEPSADVTLDLAVSNSNEGSVAPVRLVFSNTSWSGERLVTVTGRNDDLQDGLQTYRVTGVATSSDAGYSGLDMPEVVLRNVDNDLADVTVGDPNGDTTEEGGQATFTVVLNSQPTADVTITFVSSDEGEGTVAPGSVTFTPTNWNSPRNITATGVNDRSADGRQPYIIETSDAVSADGNYSGLDVSEVVLFNRDDDSPDVIVSAASGSTTEWGDQATFTIRLQSEPSAEVTIGLTSNDTDEGRVSPSSVTFDSGNWDQARTVTVTGQDDLIADGSQSYSIVTAAAVSADSGYSGRPVADVPLTNVDDDIPGVTVTSVTGPTNEWGGQATFTIRLNTQPTADVTIGLSSSDTGEGTVSPSSIVFDDQNWDTPRVVTVTGEDDAINDGAQPYTIVTADAASSDMGYSGFVVPNVAMTNLDDEEAVAAMSALDDRAMLTPCGATYPDGIRACWHYPGGTMTCPGAGTVVIDTFSVTGDVLTIYDVTLRIRGVVELKYFLGGSRAAPSGTLNSWYVGGSPDLSHEPAFNVYQMTVSSPSQTFHLNSAPSQAEERRESFEIDYQVTIPVRGGATIALTNRDSNCIANRNCGAPATPNTQCSPITLAGVTDSRVNPQPYNGQFIVMELVQVRPQ